MVVKVIILCSIKNFTFSISESVTTIEDSAFENSYGLTVNILSAQSSLWTPTYLGCNAVATY